jgi:hypothetical protein
MVKDNNRQKGKSFFLELFFIKIVAAKGFFRPAVNLGAASAQ